jgi:heme/copper-type cytochrome/quinol oxidase subunit 2
MEEPQRPIAPPARAAWAMQGRRAGYLVVAAAIIGLLYFVVRPGAPTEAPTQSPTSAPPARSEATNPSVSTLPPAVSSSPASTHANVYDITVQHGRRTSEPGVIKVVQGDVVTLRLNSDTADEFHLHGYNLHANLAPGVPITLEFTAKLSGRFPFELHKSDLELGALEVYPK